MSNPQVFTGNRPPRQDQGGQGSFLNPTRPDAVDPTQNQTHLQQNQQAQRQGTAFQNVLAGVRRLGGANAGGAGMMSPGGGNLYASLAKGTAHDWSDVVGKSAEELEEQARVQALDNAAILIHHLANVIARRIPNNQHVNVFNTGISIVARPNPKNLQLVDPIGTEFLKLVTDNNSVYHQVVSRTLMQVMAEVARYELQGRMVHERRADIVMSILMEAAQTTMTYEMVDWLCSREDGMEKFAMMSQPLRQAIQFTSQYYDTVRDRFIFLENTPCPWQRDALKEREQRYNHSNPMFNQTLGLDYGQPSVQNQTHQFAGEMTHRPDPSNQSFNHPQLDALLNQYSVCRAPNWLEQEAMKMAGQVDNSSLQQYGARMSRDYDNGNVMGTTAESDFRLRKARGEFTKEIDFNDFDREVLDFKHFNRENRLRYRLEDYFRMIEGTEWMVGSWENTVKLLTTLPCANDGTGKPVDHLLEDRFTPLFGDRAVIVSVDEHGNTRWKQVRVEGTMSGQAQNRLWTNPSEVLPLLRKDDEVSREEWRAKMMTTQEITEAKSNVGNMAELEEVPNLIATTAISRSDKDYEMHEHIDMIAKTYDPEDSADAIISTNIIERVYTLDHIQSNRVYTMLEPLVVGTSLENYSNSVELFKDLEHSLNELGEPELANTITMQLTTAVNRWMVECWGIAEQDPKNGDLWVKLDNIFTDLVPFVQLIQKNAPAMYKSFMKINENEFLVSNIQLIAPKQIANDFFDRKAGTCEEAKAVAETRKNNAIVFYREVILVKLTKDAAPITEKTIVSLESEDPRLHSIINRAIAQGRQTLKNSPTVVLTFGRPANQIPRVVSFSACDKAVVRTRGIQTSKEMLLMMPYSY